MHPDLTHKCLSQTRVVIGHLSEVLSSLVEALTVSVQLLLGDFRGRNAELAAHTCEVRASKIAEDAEL